MFQLNGKGDECQAVQYTHTLKHTEDYAVWQEWPMGVFRKCSTGWAFSVALWKRHLLHSLHSRPCGSFSQIYSQAESTHFPPWNVCANDTFISTQAVLHESPHWRRSSQAQQQLAYFHSEPKAISLGGTYEHVRPWTIFRSYI